MNSTKDLKRLETLLKMTGKTLIREDHWAASTMEIALIAVRTLNGTLSTRTHNIQLTNMKLCWENNNSKCWIYQFESNTDALDWWNLHIVTNLTTPNDDARIN